MAVASETRATDSLDEEQVKSITGGDRMRCRRMREDTWEFEPTHTLVLLTNYMPKIKGRDESIWRRVRVVPWDVTIPADMVDRNLSEKLRAEQPGILNWMVAGARRFIDDDCRFTPPDAVLTATQRYRASEDSLGRFADDVLRFGPGLVTRSSHLAGSLDEWNREQSAAVTMVELASYLKTKGCTNRRRSNDPGSEKWRGMAWEGVEINDGDDSEF